MKKFSSSEQKTLTELAARLIKLSKTKDGTTKTLNEVLKPSSKEQQRLINLLINYRPPNRQLGDRINVEKPDIELIETENQKYIDISDGKEKILASRYLPKHIYQALNDLNTAMQKDIDKYLVVNYGYRGFGYQVLMLIWFLVNVHGFDLDETLRRSSLPQYSQHCSVTNTAIDFIAYDDKTAENNLLAFSKTPEYKWLKKHGSEFGFHESFSKNNTKGMLWEPWHWQYRGKE